jgi:hypothetical protein
MPLPRVPLQGGKVVGWLHQPYAQSFRGLGYAQPLARSASADVSRLSTNCLTRGGDCGYPDSPTLERATTVTSPVMASGSKDATSSSYFPPPLASPATAPRYLTSPNDPFDAFCIPMPHKSLDLLRHFARYRILSGTAVLKNPNAIVLAMALQDPCLLRSALLVSAMHQARLRGETELGDMEETYLYHKLEGMRIVNQGLGEQTASDGNLFLIAALALTEVSSRLFLLDSPSTPSFCGLFPFHSDISSFLS